MRENREGRLTGMFALLNELVVALIEVSAVIVLGGDPHVDERLAQLEQVADCGQAQPEIC